MGLDWSGWTPEGLERIFLGILYRVRHSHGDRRPQGEQPFEADGLTGAPTSEAKLARGGTVISGIELAMKTAMHPDGIASSMILRDGEALKRIPRDRWTSDEARDVAELTYRWKKCALVMAQRGWVLLEPPVAYTREGPGAAEWNSKFASGLDGDGLPYVFHAVAAGLDEAERVIPGTEFARGAYNALAHASQADRDHAAKEVPWYHDEFRRESGAGE